MFWVGMIPLMVGLGGMIGWLGSGRRPIAYTSSDASEDEEDEDSEAVPRAARPYEADDDEGEDSEGLSSRAKFALRMVSVGAGAYLLSALIDVLTR